MVAFDLGPEVRIGPYVLKRALGRGGNGQVFLAWKDNASGRPLACVVKFSLQQHIGDADAQERNLKEARLAMCLKGHPNVVQVTDVGEYRGMVYLVMEFVDGANLHEVMKVARARRRRLPLATIYHILASVASALHFAHFVATFEGEPVNIVHRDLKPANLLVSRDGMVKLTDFGISVALEEGTEGVYLRGTKQYMSPEHLRQEVRTEMDIYALGIIAWELVENRTFRGDCKSQEELYRRIVDEDIPQVHADGVPPELVAIIQRCLHPNPQQRLSAQGVLKALSRCPGYSRDPELLAVELSTMIGSRRSSGTTKAELAATPELVATMMALEQRERGAVELEPSESTEQPDVDPDAPTVRLVREVGEGARDDGVPGWRELVEEAERAAAEAERKPKVASTAKLGPPPGIAVVEAPPRERSTAKLGPPPGVAASEGRPREMTTAELGPPPGNEPVEPRPRGRSTLELVGTADAVTSSDAIVRAPVPPARRRRRLFPIAVGTIVSAGLVAGLAAVYSGNGSTEASPVEPRPSMAAHEEPSAPELSVAQTTAEPSPKPRQEPTVQDVATASTTIDADASADVVPAMEPAEPPPALPEPAPSEAPSEPDATDEATPTSAPPSKPPPPPRVPIVVAIDFLGGATVKIGSKRAVVHSNADLDVPAGTHRVKWRSPTDTEWQDGGRHRFAATHRYLIRLRPTEAWIVDLGSEPR